MKKILIIGIAMIAFGLANFFRYVLVSLSLINRPFPFEHLKNVTPERGGIGIEIGYIPTHEAVSDPYWLMWSIMLYAGIGLVLFAVWRRK